MASGPLSVHPPVRSSLIDRAQVFHYDPQMINNLLHIEECKSKDLDDAAHVLGDIITCHKAERLLAVTRLHYHYPMQGREMVVIRERETDSSKIIIKIPESYGSLEEEKQALVPISFMVRADGVIFTNEFMDRELADRIGVSLKLSALLTDHSELLQALVASMCSNNFTDSLGFQIIYEDEVLTKTNEGDEVMEENYNRYQEMCYKPLTKDMKPTVTSWRFSVRVPAADTDFEDAPPCAGQKPKGPKKVNCNCISRTVCHSSGGGGHSSSDEHSYHQYSRY